MSKIGKAEKANTAAEATKAAETETVTAGAAKANEPETDADKAMIGEKTAAEKESAGKAEGKGSSQTQRVYCGPSIKDVVREGTVFSEGIPEALEEYIQKNPAVRSLIVPLTDFAAFRADIGRRGTPANIIYNNVLSVTKRRK